MIKTKAKKICFDFDDAVWTSHPSVKLTLKIKKKNFKNRTRLLNIVKNVDLVICGNQYLCSNIWDFTPNTLILPTSIDIDKYCPTLQEKTEKKNFVVGWIGTNSNIFFMKNIFESIKKIEGIQIKVVSNKNLNVNLPRGVIFEIWDANREVEQIRSFNIGLMPLLDDEYTRGKCGFKIIQYMSCGVVPIASDVGFNRDIISHGQDGFLVKKEHEWIKYIQMLREDVSLQKKMSTNARKKIEKNFNIKNSASILLRKIQSLL
ncbi:glycosyltransferase [Desulfonauticus submarinus]